MTDEEKAEEYADKILSDSNEEKLNEMKNRISMELKDVTLQQGFEIICKRIAEQEKENEQLKKDKEYLDNTNNEQTKVILELQAQIEQLSNDNHVLKTSFITQQEQIEKMKCCGNCRHNGSDSEIGENGDYTDYTCIQCDDFSTKENPYPNWELAE